MENEQEKTPGGRTVWGVGPKIMVPGFLAFAAFGVLQFFLWPWGTISLIPPFWVRAIGLLLSLAGLVVVSTAVRSVRRAIKDNRLLTGGLYRYVRHPLYAGHFFLLWPGIALLFLSWLMLLGVVTMIVLFFCFIAEEERKLYEEFGLKYLDYSRRTPLLFPFPPRGG